MSIGSNKMPVIMLSFTCYSVKKYIFIETMENS